MSEPKNYQIEFDETWDECSILGVCERKGSEGYYLVKTVWIEAGKPADVADFIISRTEQLE